MILPHTNREAWQVSLRIDIRLVLAAARTKIILYDLLTKMLGVLGWDNGDQSR